jgi:hypothetical protein
MPGILQVGKISAAKGEVKYGSVGSFELRDGSSVNIPAIVVNGAREGRRLLCIAGHHPNETLGIEATIQVCRKKLDPDRMSGAFVGITCANPFGLLMGMRTNLFDEEFLDEAYPGKSDGSLSKRIAKLIWDEAILNSDVIMDLHSNFKPALNFALVGRALDERVEREALSLARLTGVTTIQSVDEPKRHSQIGDVREICMSAGKPAFAFEGNGSNTLEQEDVDVMVRGIINVCKGMKIVEGPIEEQNGIKVVRPRAGLKFTPIPGMFVRASRGGIVTRAVGPGDFVSKGGAIARIHNLHGEELETVRAPVDGYAWGFPLRTKAGLQTQAVYAGAEVAYWFTEIPEQSNLGR